MPGDYRILAPLYDTIGLASYAQRMTPRLMDYVLQTLDWVGRRIVVLGCGTGASIEYLSHYPYNVTGIDNSPDMLEVAQRKLTVPGLSLNWQQLDIRELGNRVGSADLVLAIHVMNELNSLRDLEAVFTNVHRILEPQKLFIFDMITIQGLTEAGTAVGRMLYDDPNSLTVFAANEYDYERQQQITEYLIFQLHNDGWLRQDAKRVLKAFPVQAVASLLQRNQFTIRAILNDNLESHDPNGSIARRVIFVAEKS